MTSQPIINPKIDEDVVFSAKDYFKYKSEVEGHTLPEIPKKCILCFEKSFIDYAKDSFSCKELVWFRKDLTLHLIKSKSDKENLSEEFTSDNSILIVNVSYGAPFASIAVEELIALGVTDFIVLGSAGTLQKDIGLGSLVIAESAIREEGVSYHYLTPSKEVYASKKLLSKAISYVNNSEPVIAQNFKFGSSWTTDSFYRETISKTKQYQSEGVLTVDMESSALYAIAQFRKVDVLCMFFVSDSIANLKWDPHFHKTNSKETQKNMFDLAVKILS